YFNKFQTTPERVTKHPNVAKSCRVFRERRYAAETLAVSRFKGPGISDEDGREQGFAIRARCERLQRRHPLHQRPGSDRRRRAGAVYRRGVQRNTPSFAKERVQMAGRVEPIDRVAANHQLAVGRLDYTIDAAGGFKPAVDRAVRAIEQNDPEALG